MSVRFPSGFVLERLALGHVRKSFRSGQAAVDDWLKTKALQHQEKHLSVTRVLTDNKTIAGYFTLATAQIDFSDLPPAIASKLPKRQLPVAVLAWLGVAEPYQGKGLGKLLLAQALADCHAASQTFAFIAVILDCIDDAAKAFYEQFNFAELPGHPYRLYLSAEQLAEMMKTP